MPRRLIGAPRRQYSPTSEFRDSLKGIFTRNFIIVLLINLIVMTIYFLVFITGAQYVLEQYGTSLSVAGLSAGILVLGCLAGRFLGGHLFTILGGKKLLLTGLLLYCLSFLLVMALNSLGGVFLARFATGFGEGLAVTATGTIAAWAIPKECKGFGISIFSLSTVLGLALGPFLGIQLNGFLSYQELMRAMLLSSIVLLPGALFLKNMNMAHKIHRRGLDLYAYIDPRVARFSVVIGLVFMSYGCIQAYLTSLAGERGLSESASFFFLVYGIAAIVSRPFTGRAMDARGENVILYPMFLVIIFGLLLLAWAHSGAALLLAGALCGLGYGNFQSIGQAVSLCLVTPARFSQATTTYFNFMDFGIGFGPFLFGYVAAYCGYANMFAALGGVILLALILYHFLHGRALKNCKAVSTPV